MTGLKAILRKSYKMRHRVAGRKLGRNTSQRIALARGLITELFRHDRISTTEAKARFMRGEAEHLITMAKHGLAEGGNPVHARRLAGRVITDPDVAKRLFDEIAPRFVDRPGGYTRIIKVGPRFGDNAPMAVLELVERGAEEKGKEEKPKAKKPKAAAKPDQSKAKAPKAATKPDKGKEQASKATGKPEKGKEKVSKTTSRSEKGKS
jgi:large subunit ribosomal protein L17